MDVVSSLATLFVSMILGGILGFALWQFTRSQILKRAQGEAQDLIQEARDLVEMRELEEKERYQELEIAMWTKVEPDMLKIEERIEELDSLVEENKQKYDAAYQEKRRKLQSKEAEIRAEEQKLQNRQKNFQNKKNDLQNINQQMIQSLGQKLSTTADEIKSQIKQNLESEYQQRALKHITRTEEDAKENSEAYAKRALDAALNRFARPYSSERGIGAVSFPDANIRKLFCDPEGKNIKAVQDACGCDIIVETDMEMVGVAGFDPVRRELTRRTLERLFKEKRQINPDVIKRIAEAQKRELFKQIKNDGDAVARELRLENLHPEIKQMMGSLRYRYSFTQNQYFHCAEVGWLCGLLSSEINIDTKKGRRSGLLHDIGKSMDHAMDGGHAVIGANFIAARGEAADIVHNVRAHHYDEQPSSDHAFLVIAADAISGARPGARRSTIESYNQKVNELQEIARSFEGVTDCFILNGGRECRVVVDSKKIDDNRALSMSHEMAHKIEEECNYPGQIKVVIVRETFATESTMANARNN